MTMVVGRHVSLDGRASSDPDGSIAAYGWSLGDGRRAAGPTVEVDYAADGEYAITLIVTDNRGAQRSLTRRVQVSGPPPPAPPPNQAPTAVLVASPASGPAPLSVKFDASASADPEGQPLLAQVAFGDGTPSQAGTFLTHLYRTPGTFLARLTVTDDDGATGTSTATITVGPPVTNQPPTAQFTINGA